MAGTFNKIKNATHRLFDKFFYDSEEAADTAYQDDSRYPQQGQPYQAFAPQPEEDASAAFTPQTAFTPQSQPVYQPQPDYRQPMQPEVQPASAYYGQQQTPPAVQTQYSAQMQPPQRNRRARQAEDNVVQFPVEQPSQAAYFKPEQPASQAPAEAAPGTDPLRRAKPVTGIRVMNIRSIMDCRAAISLLRQGDLVLVTMETVGDANEMRRFVDTLSGACFSLMSTITKVSRYGTYLLAPVSMGVYCDAVISQMNSAGRAKPKAQPQQQPAPAQGYGAMQPGQGEYPPQQYQQYQQYQQPQQPEYAYRQPAPAAPVQPEQQFYARPAQQEARRPVFEQQAARYGYSPDREEEEAEAEAR